MKRFARFATVVLAAGLLATPVALKAQGPPPPGWDAPPRDFTRDIQRNGFHDGIEGARRDAENHRPPNVMNRDEFRNYRGPERRVYRDAFQRGYNTFWSHMGPGGPPPPPRPY